MFVFNSQRKLHIMHSNYFSLLQCLHITLYYNSLISKSENYTRCTLIANLMLKFYIRVNTIRYTKN